MAPPNTEYTALVPSRPGKLALSITYDQTRADGRYIGLRDSGGRIGWLDGSAFNRVRNNDIAYIIRRLGHDGNSLVIIRCFDGRNIHCSVAEFDALCQNGQIVLINLMASQNQPTSTVA